MKLDASINRIEYNDGDIFNHIIARGPGEGLDRFQYVERDTASIALYGERQIVLDVPDATSVTDLETAVTLWQAGTPQTPKGVGAPRVEMEVEIFFSIDSPPDIKRGDTIRVVSQEMGIQEDNVIKELDWRETSATLFFGKEPASLVELFRREVDTVRPNLPLGLLLPLNFAANTLTTGGIGLSMTSVSGAADRYEIYGSKTNGFNPLQFSPTFRGSFTTQTFVRGNSGETWYFQARRFDNKGNFSAFTAQRSAVFG